MAYTLKGIIRKHISHYFQTYKMIQTSRFSQDVECCKTLTFIIKRIWISYIIIVHFFLTYQSSHPQSKPVPTCQLFPIGIHQEHSEGCGQRNERNYLRPAGTCLHAKQWTAKDCVHSSKVSVNPFSESLAQTKNSWG